MDVRPYRGAHPAATRALYREGVLKSYPVQAERTDLTYDEGVDIVYEFKRMTPARFASLSDFILEAAYQEGERYADEKYKFVKIEVKLHRTKKGRRTVDPTRTYIAAKHTSSEIMVYGEQALGYLLPESYKSRPFLINKVEEIINMVDTDSPGPYVNKSNPYTVISMSVCIRAGNIF